MNNIKFGSLFAGIGGFDLGLEQASMECCWQVEIDERCREVLAAHWPEVKRYGDVNQVEGSDLEAVDLISGGWPCQDLSVAGKRGGIHGDRSILFFEALRLIQDLKPRWFIFENVPGLLSSRKGQDFAIVIQTLAECGYCVSWRVLDAQWFGVAQRRRRVFIVGSLGNTGSAKVLFERESGAWDSAPSREAGQELARDVGACLKGGSGERGFPIEFEAGLATFRMTAFGKYADDNIGSVVKAKDYKDATDLVAPCLTSRMGRYSSPDPATGKGTPIVVATLNSGGNDGGFRTELGEHLVAFTQRSRNGQISIESQEEMAYALRPSPASSKSTAVAGSMGVRRLTPTECERLQGFPDGWTAGHSDSARYKMLGNAVAVPVVQWIGNRIMDHEKGRL